MVLKAFCVLMFVSVLLLVSGLVLDDSHQACAGGWRRTSPDLFYNYYAPPGPCGGVGAQLYLAPRPTPPLVGHTYFTYQPLMPHEFLYQHHRTYIRRHPNGHCTRTVVTWD